ncbi:UNVERIFIED_CONTAM: hypothetical protein GTU68_032936, partial [Idotea baltica]|nr:hypothetical protein [Idotea baltica]
PQVSKSCSLTNFVERKFKKIVSQRKNSNEVSKRPISFNFSKSQNYSNANSVDYKVQKIYQCHFCFVRFEAKDDLLLHLEVHKGKRIFTCSICSKSFLQKCDLIRHIQIHSGERNFVCELCKATFIQKSTLRTHMLIHTGEKSFSCNFCEKKFSRKYYMSQHLKVHYKDKPFPCSLCNMKFKHRSTLMTHMRIHLGTKCFGCRNCKKSYNSLKSLSTHISSNHSKAESFCTLCNLTLDQKELNLHIKRHILEKLKKINSLKEIEKERSITSSEDQIQNFNDNYLPTNFIDVNNSKKELNSAYEVICSDNKDDVRVLIKDFPLNETETFPDDKQLIDPLLLSEI